jgi:hypothetical protein
MAQSPTILRMHPEAGRPHSTGQRSSFGTASCAHEQHHDSTGAERPSGLAAHPNFVDIRESSLRITLATGFTCKVKVIRKGCKHDANVEINADPSPC